MLGRQILPLFGDENYMRIILLGALGQEKGLKLNLLSRNMRSPKFQRVIC